MPKKVYSIKGENDKSIYLTVERFDKENVALVACNKEGVRIPGGYIAIVNKNGLSLCTSLTHKANLPLDNAETFSGSHIKLLSTR